MYVSRSIGSNALPLKDKTSLAVKTHFSISVIGLGYVGVVSAACLAKMGHKIIGVDICPEKLEQLKKGRTPIVEPGLGDLLSEGVKAGQISTSDDILQAVQSSEVSFVSVNTPTAEDGSCDVRSLQAVARKLGRALRDKSSYHLVVMRCSVPPGTTLERFVPIIERISGKREGVDFGVCFNPEFLRESTAIADFGAPPKTIIGANHSQGAQLLAHILSPLDAKPILTDIATAEMVKYVDNVWHATKVCFGNEIGRICQAVGVDGWEVIRQFSQDTVLNISPHYLKPGFAYGGSCLPKEVRAMNAIGKSHDLSLPLMNSLAQSNEAQITRAHELIMQVGAKHVGICGITFKPDTDDLRESPILDLAGRLLNDGVEVFVTDPNYTDASLMMRQVSLLRGHYSHYADIVERLTFRLVPDVSELLKRTDVLVTAHATASWRDKFQGQVSQHHIVDLARLFKSIPVCKSYYGIGW